MVSFIATIVSEPNTTLSLLSLKTAYAFLYAISTIASSKDKLSSKDSSISTFDVSKGILHKDNNSFLLGDLLASINFFSMV